MSKRTGFLLFLALMALFLVVNRPAYKGYFTDDDFDTLSWTRHASIGEFAKGLLSPGFQTNNFRPVGHLLYRVEWQLFGWDFKKYLATTHALHFLNIWLIWLLARKLGAKPFAAAAGCVFFALHPGYFEAVWKPAYVFDVLCATFCLLSLLSYVRGRWVVSFLCFWLAYKSKELAVMVPFVLACYEIWYGKHRWKPLAPFFLVSCWFAIQALWWNSNSGQESPYTFHFTLGALAVTSTFYASRVFLIEDLGLVVPIAAWFSRNRRVWLGTAVMLLFLTPVLFLPGRIDNAYAYLPFAGLAIALTGAAEMCHPAIIIACLVLFAPLELHDMRLQRRDTLARADDARAWVTTWSKYAATAGPVDTFLLNGAPPGFGNFGIAGAIKCLYSGSGYQIHTYEKPPITLEGNHVAILTWTQGLHKLDIVTHGPDTPDVPYIDVNSVTPVWQLGDGWSNPEGGFRWITPLATARLERPGSATQFEMRVLTTSSLLQSTGAVTVQISLNGVDLPPQRATQVGWQTLSWNLPAAPSGAVNLTIHTDPPFHSPGDPRVFGIAVGAFGFR